MKKIIARENIDYIQIKKNIRGMMKNILRDSKMEIWCCGFQRIPKLRRGNSFFGWIDPF
jgi:hypothetical protein